MHVSISARLFIDLKEVRLFLILNVNCREYLPIATYEQ